MPNINDQNRQALAARVQFYRELGIHSFYRRGEALTHEASQETVVAESAAEVSPELPIAKKQPISGDKNAALRVILDEIGECTRCRLHKGRDKLVFGTGNINADIMFVGEGPGADEDEQGLPFVGRAGQLLNNMITAMGIKREDVY